MRPTPSSSSVATTVVREDGSTMASTINGLSLGITGPAKGPPLSGGPAGGNKGKPFAHFDDINNVRLDVDINTPLETLLRRTEESLKAAQFLKDIGRLDKALEEYLKASIVLLQVLPSSAAWMSVKADKKGARIRYNALLAQVNAASPAYENIKTLIKDDNARSGVQPKSAQSAQSAQNAQNNARQSQTGQASTGQNQHGRSMSTAVASSSRWPDVPTSRVGDVATTAQTQASRPPTTAPSKTKPAIHPKPHSLHGNAVKPGGTTVAATNNTNSKSAQDLAERFASLRASKPAEPMQDPRIRTQPINLTSFQQQPQPTQSQAPPSQQPPQQQTPQQPPQQAAPSQFQNFRFGPSATRPYPPLMAALTDLPKVPEAIYSPARGTVSSQAAQPPSGTPKGVFSRNNSTTSFTGMTKTPAPQGQAEDYFSLRLSSDRSRPRPHQEAAPPVRRLIPIPDGDTITAQDLLRFMKAGSKDIQVLVIDIRSREEFDEGHIMSQSTICIETDTLQRENISAGDIADSMVLAPETEKRLFERRHEFDLVVYYDQESQAVGSVDDDCSATEIAVTALYNALGRYDFLLDGSENTKRPKLLKGGLDAWTAMMGSASLQTSATTAGVNAKASQQLQRARYGLLTRPSTKYMAKPIQDAAEAKRWEENLKDMERSAIVRTTDDFLRRFPPVSAISESMTSPAVTDSSSTRSSFQGVPSSRASVVTTGTVATVSMDRERPASAAALASALPTPPTRPAPTLPRQSHSGLDEADDEEHYMRTKLAKAGVSSGRARRRHVGLYNPGNWCYGNSSFQSLFASGSFADELTMGEWVNHWKVPMKSDEKINHPQLLTKILANWFHWMQYGKFEAMKAKMLMEYCYQIHSHDFDGSTKTDRSTIFGGPYQQDAQEFISFLLTNLHDETNRLRDRTGEVQQPVVDGRSTALSNGLQFWRAYRQYNDSLVDKYWRGIEVTDRRCRSCGHPSLTYEPFDALHLPIPPTSGGASTTNMADLLKQYCSADMLAEYKCDACRRIDTTEKRVRLARLPDLLCISFRRFQGNEHFGFRKNNTAVLFPIDGLNMTPYSVQGQMTPQDVAAELRTAAAAATAAGEGTGTSADPQFCAPFIYDCYAVIVHSGTLRSGHYRSFVRDESGPDNHQWHHFDDARVEAVTIGSGDSRDMARRLYRDSDMASAYVVFYKRRR